MQTPSHDSDLDLGLNLVAAGCQGTPISPFLLRTPDHTNQIQQVKILSKKPPQAVFLIYTIGMEQQINNAHKRWSVILAFALPVILIVGVLISSEASFMKAKTQYDFVYAVCDRNDNRYYYDECSSFLSDVIQVDDAGQFYRGEVNPNRDSNNDGVLDKDEGYDIRFFYHNSAQNETREILERDLAQYTFNPLLISPDGATIEYDYRSGPDVLFVDVGGSGYEYRLVQGNREKTLNLVDGVNNRYRWREFEFVGWVMSTN